MNKKIFFVGICGVGMSSLAKLSQKMGYKVEGSDIYYCENSEKLELDGIKVNIGHNKNNINCQDLVVYSSAVSNENIELKEAKKNNIPIVSRADYLKYISSLFRTKIGVCGSHGKTTATAMLGDILIQNKKPCGIVLGGDSVNFGNTYYDGSEFFLSEICEYKKNIDKFFPDIAICLNIDNDHLECYKSFDDLIESFYGFLNKAKYKIINIDDENLNNFQGVNVISFALKNEKADYFAKITKAHKGEIYFDVYKKNTFYFSSKIKSICLHNIYNVLASICTADVLKISLKDIGVGLKKYAGVKRRMEFLGEKNDIKYFADYAHHPTEIESTIKSFKKNFNNDFTVIFQPHTFSRTKLLFNKFLNVLGQCDSLMIYKTYPSRENEKDGMSGYDLALALNCAYATDTKKISDEIIRLNKKAVLFLGAGDIYEIAKYLVKKL